MSRADSSAGWEPDAEEDGSAEARVDGSAVRIEGSNSRVLSSVLGTFSARRFYPKSNEFKAHKSCKMTNLFRSRIIGFKFCLSQSLL